MIVKVWGLYASSMIVKVSIEITRRGDRIVVTVKRRFAAARITHLPITHQDLLQPGTKLNQALSHSLSLYLSIYPLDDYMMFRALLNLTM